VTDLPPIDEGPDERNLIEQLQAELAGEVVAMRRQARWRPAWFVDVQRDGQLLELYVRGARTDMRPIFPLEHECRMQELLGSMGIPVAEVRGYLHRPPAIVMERMHGKTDFAGCSDAERRSVMDEYIQILARMHHLAVDAFVGAGAQLPERPFDAALTGIRAYERAYRLEKVRPDPFMEFCLGWLTRNPPRHRVRPSVVVWDSGQFLHRNGRISGLLDLELTHIGDPMMDLAGLRMRSSVIDYGPLDQLYRRYEDLTGDEVDLEALAYHHFAFTITTQLAYHRGLVEPTSDSDLMTYMHWCSESNLYAVEALAGFAGIDLEKVALPEPAPSPSAVGHQHLVDSIRAMAGRDERSTYQLRIAFRLARHLQRVDAIGASITECDLDDVAAIIGYRPAGWVESERELERFVIGADARFDGPLIRLFHRRLQRQRALLGPEGSAMTRHSPLPLLPPSSD
jgi:aminoglycoside phosphotransferase (APT) family kinase protein